MPLIISSSVVLAASLGGIDPDLPLVGYDNIVTTTNVSATSSDPAYPVSRLANPATHLEWMASTSAIQYLTVTTTGLENTEYIGVVGHNWGTIGATVSVEVLDAGFSPPAWTEIEAQFMPGDDSPIMWRISPRPESFRIKIAQASSPPSLPKAAVLQAGALLVMQRKIYSQHLPITYGRKLLVSNGRSESGKFLGRVVLGEDNDTIARFRLITPEWFRDNIPPFLDVAKESPFFFAWRPNTYPEEVGYCWLTDDPAPTPEDPSSNNYIAFDMKMSGIA
jgi:hypothetical protein